MQHVRGNQPLPEGCTGDGGPEDPDAPFQEREQDATQQGVSLHRQRDCRDEELQQVSTIRGQEEAGPLLVGGQRGSGSLGQVPCHQCTHHGGAQNDWKLPEGIQTAALF